MRMYVSKWLASLEQDDLLINAVRNYLCIYDVRSGEFKVALVKENAWRGIAATMQRTGKMILLVLVWFSTHIMTVCLAADVRLRWRTLRDRYVRKNTEKEGTVWHLLAKLFRLGNFSRA